MREEVSGQRLDFGRAVAGLRRFEAPAGLHVKQQRSLVVAEQPRKAAVAHAEILKKKQQQKNRRHSTSKRHERQSFSGLGSLKKNLHFRSFFSAHFSNGYVSMETDPLVFYT